MKNSNKLFEYHGLDIKKLPFIFHYDIAGNTQPIHNWHKNIEILHFIKGKGIVEAGVEKFEVKKDDIVIFNSNVPHAITSEKNVEYYCFIPDSEFCEKNDIPTNEIHFEPLVCDDGASALYRRLCDEFAQVGIYRNASIKAAALNLIVYLAKEHGTLRTDNSSSGTTNHSIQLVISYILANIDGKFTIDNLSEQAGMSKYYFIREFKKATGETPVTFINRNRCEIAKRMLKTGEYSVAETSEKTGFESCAYFCKTFKKFTGMTPKKYK